MLYATCCRNISTVHFRLTLVSEQVSADMKHDAVSSFGRFQLKQVTASADVKSDNSLSASVSLSSCELDDTRPDRQTGVTRYVRVISHPKQTNRVKSVLA